jgi:hypothetical protein
MDRTRVYHLSEVSKVYKAKGPMVSLLCGIYTQYKYKQYYEKEVMLRVGGW